MLDLHGLSVDRFEAAAGVRAIRSRALFDLPAPGGSLVWRTRNESALAGGYATLNCSAPVVAQVVFASIGEEGETTGMATVFSSQAATVFQFPVLTPAATLGFAIANDTDADAACRLVLDDPQGANLGEGTLSVPSKSNLARSLHQVITIPGDFTRGSATVSCNQLVAMIGLHFELQPDGTIITFNTLPPAVVDPSLPSSDQTAKSFHVLPHLADGGGWQSLLLVTNVSQSASFCALDLYGLSVDRFEAAAGVTAAGLTATFELPGAGGHRVLRTRNESALAAGYATLNCSAPVVAQLVFASIGEEGETTGMATVFSSQAATVFQFPVLTPAATLGFAIANDTDADAACRLVLESPQSANLDNPQRLNRGEATLSVPSKSNLARSLHQVITIPGDFTRGSATVSCNQLVAMIGLHFELQPDGTIITFNTLPPAVLDTSPQTINEPEPPSVSKVYWTGGRGRTIMRANLDGTQEETLFKVGDDPGSIVGGSEAHIIDLELDLVAGKMYWTEDVFSASRTDRIVRANLDGTGVEYILPQVGPLGLGEPRALELDPVAGKMYWIDRHSNKIQRANLDGTQVEDVLPLSGRPSDLELNPDITKMGKMYWTDSTSSTRTIRWANLNGTGVEDLLSVQQAGGWPTDLELHPNNLLYWTASKVTLVQGFEVQDFGPSIRRAYPEGSRVEDVVSPEILSYPTVLALDPVADKAYWVDEEIRGGITLRANLDGTQVEILDWIGTPDDLELAPGGPVTLRAAVQAQQEAAE